MHRLRRASRAPTHDGRARPLDRGACHVQPHVPGHRGRRDVTEGIDDAIRNAVKRASSTLRHLDWFEVTQIRGHVVDDEVEHFQVGLKLGFRLEDDE